MKLMIGIVSGVLCGGYQSSMLWVKTFSARSRLVLLIASAKLMGVRGTSSFEPSKQIVSTQFSTY